MFLPQSLPGISLHGACVIKVDLICLASHVHFHGNREFKLHVYGKRQIQVENFFKIENEQINTVQNNS